MAIAGSSATMRAVTVDHAAPGRFVIADAPIPEPGPADALIRVKAFSLNRGETRVGLTSAAPGWRPGWDVSGIVERAAADGSGPPQGARVVGATLGGWAQFAALPGERMAELPDEVSFAQAATLPVAGLTARAALAKGGDLRGKRVLVGGASGGVGTFALQLARHAGAVVTASVRSRTQEAMVRSLGANHVAAGSNHEAAASFGPFDLILESVGERSLAAALEMLAPGATCVLLGASAGARTDFDASKFRVGGTSLYGLVMSYEFAKEPPRIGLAELARLTALGIIKPVIERQAPWTQIAEVARDLTERKFSGKAVLHVE